MRIFLLLGGFFSSMITALPATAQVPAGTAAPTRLVRRWYVPQHAVLQAAGGIGMVSGGVGYGLFRKRLEVDALAGYVPRRYAGREALGIFTFKTTYTPYTIPLRNAAWRLHPLSFGGLVNYTPSRTLNRSRDEKYYDGYYWWSSTVRFGAFVGGRVARQLKPSSNGQPREVSLYYELGTNDLYVVSLATNLSGLKVTDVLTLGVGGKFAF
ncbi:conserved hypothetical protein [Hymenobacter roseosalivarius DSM 11622]|uniref:Outer membrane protein beta-barrel domain-containing protein n=1 Tax=Hymenobacter roseosalivarius DSM 11622 TaxID=645990 RepID=A0A1W1UPN1_9BACT|nr:hypothetical protein [Hymenobacter roseosalivarius]SMB83098.1 conserved hypothetical protein [Hymenobacter roseosalivarius DSM 11622]